LSGKSVTLSYYLLSALIFVSILFHHKILQSMTMKVPLFQWANKCETEALGRLAVDIEQYGVIYNDAYGREDWLKPDDERVEQALKIVRRAVINDQWRRDGHDEAPNGYVPWDDDEWTRPYEEDTASMFFVTITDDLQYCPPKQRISASGVRTTNTERPQRFSEQSDLISAYLLKYFFETHEDFRGEASEKLMRECMKYSTRKDEFRNAIGLAQSVVKDGALRDNLDKFCTKYMAHKQL